MLNLFQHLIFVNPDNKEIPKPVRNDDRVFAFTLAEVLITLVIIGVVAALTIPNLMQKYTEQTTVKKVQKFYSSLSNAVSLSIKENGPIDTWGLVYYDAESSGKIYNLLFKPYFKIAKNCGTNNTGNCLFTGKYKLLNNDMWSTGYHSGAYYKVLLEDGAAIWFVTSGSTTNTNLINVMYDVNGLKAPNQWGRDTFNFTVNNTIVYPNGAPRYSKTAFKTYCNTKSTTASSGMKGCTAWLIYKGNMDYLHCDGLDWDGKDKCK